MTTSRKIIKDYCYDCSNRLGDGLSSEVYAGYNTKTKEPVAIKIIPKIEHSLKENLIMAETEIKVLQELSGKDNIVQLYFTTQTRNNIYIVLQHATKGCLAEVIKEQGKIPENRALHLLKQIANGYRNMAQHHYLHRDIKPSNLLLTNDDTLFLGDFGLSLKEDTGDASVLSRVGSPLYMAPEIIDQKTVNFNSYSQKSDIWAIGLTFLEMLLGRTVMRSQSQKELVEEITNFSLQKVLPEGLSDLTVRFLKRSLEKDPLKRMGLSELIAFFHKNGPSEEAVKSQEMTIRARGVNQVCDEVKKEETGIHIDYVEEEMSTEKMKINEIHRVDEGGSSANLEPSWRRERKMSYQEEINFLSLRPEHRERKQSVHLSSHFQPEKKKKVPQVKQRHKEKTLEQMLEEDPEEIREQAKRESSLAKEEILKQLQGHINYFRFVFKLFKKVKETLKIKDKGIDTFKSSLLHLFTAALQQARELSHVRNVESRHLNRFRESPHYSNLVLLLDSYSKKGEKQQEKDQVATSYKGDFLALLDYVMNVLYHNIVSFQKNPQILVRKKILVFLLEDLMLLAEMVVSSKKYNWRQINKRTGLSERLSSESAPKDVNEEYWKEVKQKFQSLTRK